MTSPRRCLRILAVSALLLGVVACSEAADDTDGDAADDATSSASGDPADGVLEDFCIAAGLVRFMSSGEDLHLWAESMGAIEHPDDFGGDAEAGLELLREYAASVPLDAVAEELEQPEFTAAETAQLEAYSTYLEGCPQVTDAPTTLPTD